MGIGKSPLENLVKMGAGLNFWSNRRVLVTGHTGFKGAWLTYWLHSLGADVTGIALNPITQPSLYDDMGLGRFCDSRIHDIRDLDFLVSVINEKKPDLVFHLAAQPLVKFGYTNPTETFSVNLVGTLSLLEALRLTQIPRVAIMVTTDKVYKNYENNRPFVEADQLGGDDPYSASKAGSELIINSYQESFLSNIDIRIGVARAGNVIGGGDWSEDRLVPDAIRAWSSKKPLSVRNPFGVRPWQHVLECLMGYMTLAENIWRDPLKAGPYNFGPTTQDTATVQVILEMLKRRFRGDAVIEYEKKSDYELYKESQTLQLDSTKAIQGLNFSPVWTLDGALDKTVNWYNDYLDGVSALDLCSRDIFSFEQMLTVQRINSL